MVKELGHLSLVTEAEWRDAQRRALHFARKRRSRHPFAHALPDAEEIVQTVVEKMFSGERQWSPDQVSLVRFMCGVVQSLYYNASKKLIETLEFDENKYQGNDSLVDIDQKKYKEEDLHFLREAYKYLRENEPLMAEFFISAAKLAASGDRTEGQISAALGLSQSSYTKRKQRVLKRMQGWIMSSEFYVPNSVERAK